MDIYGRPLRAEGQAPPPQGSTCAPQSRGGGTPLRIFRAQWLKLSVVWGTTQTLGSRGIPLGPTKICTRNGVNILERYEENHGRLSP